MPRVAEEPGKKPGEEGMLVFLVVLEAKTGPKEKKKRRFVLFKCCEVDFIRFAVSLGAAGRDLPALVAAWEFLGIWG